MMMTREEGGERKVRERRCECGGERQRMKRKKLEEDSLKQTSALANYMALRTPHLDTTPIK